MKNHSSTSPHVSRPAPSRGDPQKREALRRYFVSPAPKMIFRIPVPYSCVCIFNISTYIYVYIYIHNILVISLKLTVHPLEMMIRKLYSYFPFGPGRPHCEFEGGYIFIGVYRNIYLEPTRPLFWGVDLQFYGSNLPKYGSFGF